ncbi:GDP-mannose 4,6-dehydratase [Nocardioides soli]|uniref:GDP-mannose 4,6-dehydratase n=1 Tax=Nocardioides soli TaxID=1036020 RepID=A0A7W4VUX4_9ACTN|nr:GDP-mannose 4,6-dehydratase [Nocardioides soli]MBB3042219.1 GDPmannose 4,6-dehydratase [Nocardioides soli]
MARAFVTGATGQDGSYLVERLLAEGVDVHALASPHEPVPAIEGVEVHVGDLLDGERIRTLLLEVSPDEVYNLAALSSVARSWEQPDLTARLNGTAAAALMESAWQLQEHTGRAVRFVQASSAEIFGEPELAPQGERTPVRPLNPYGAAKAFAHLSAHVYRQRGLHATSVILYNHESPRRPRQFVTRKITSTVAEIALGRAETLTLGNLDARRDWGWAPDYVDAMVRAARADQAADFVVATGVSHSVRDFAAAAFDRAGVPDWEARLLVDEALVRPADATELVGDASRARDVLGWAPTVPFEELVGRMVNADLAALAD